MGKALTKDEVVDFLKQGGKLIGDLALSFYGETISQAGEKAFSEAIEIGIENTIAALYEAKVDDKEILRVVSEHWGLTFKEVEDRLIWEKQNSTIRSLKQYLRLQGYSTSEIDAFVKDTQATIQIRHNKELWKLKNAPEKLIKEIKSKK